MNIRTGTLVGMCGAALEVLAQAFWVSLGWGLWNAVQPWFAIAETVELIGLAAILYFFVALFVNQRRRAMRDE